MLPMEERLHQSLMQMITDPSDDEASSRRAACLPDALKYYKKLVPKALKTQYSEWFFETLDDLFVPLVEKTSQWVCRFDGLALVMSKQHMIPFYATNEVSPKDSVIKINVAIGARFPEGKIIRMAADSPESEHWVQTLESNKRPLAVEWIYRAELSLDPRG